MNREEIAEKLKEIDIDLSNVIITSEKKAYPRDGISTVGLFSRELKWDLWFWDDYTKDLYCLKACWKDRKQYPTEVFKGNTKYQVPLSDFLTYIEIREQLREKQKGNIVSIMEGDEELGLYGDSRSIDNKEVFVGNELQPKSIESETYKSCIAYKEWKERQKDSDRSSGWNDLSSIDIGISDIQLTDNLDATITLCLRELPIAKLQAILDIIKK